jgi:hypothetical protein
MMIVNIPTVLFAERATRWVPVKVVRIVAALIYAILGVITFLNYSHVSLAASNYGDLHAGFRRSQHARCTDQNWGTVNVTPDGVTIGLSMLAVPRIRCALPTRRGTTIK